LLSLGLMVTGSIHRLLGWLYVLTFNFYFGSRGMSIKNPWGVP